MSIVPPPPPNYSLKFSPAMLASDYAGWQFIDRGFDEHGSYVAIQRDDNEVQYLLRGLIGDEWLLRNLTTEQLCEVL
jgi:hypothetical protein